MTTSEVAPGGMIEPTPLRPTALVDVSTSAQDAAVIRIGKVTRYDAAAIIVALSGSDVLATAAYLIGQYFPALGDTVAVAKSGASWLVLGTLSGPIEDNQVANYSFEDGAVGVAPPSWGRYHLPASTATASFTTEASTRGYEIDGSKTCQLYLTVPAGTGFYYSEDYVYSAPITVQPGERWAASAHALGFYLLADGVQIAAAPTLTWYANDTDVYPTTVAADSDLQSNLFNSSLPWVRLTTPGDQGGVAVPAGASFLRVVLHSYLAVDRDEAVQANAVAVLWDRVIVRRIS